MPTNTVQCRVRTLAMMLSMRASERASERLSNLIKSFTLLVFDQKLSRHDRASPSFKLPHDPGLPPAHGFDRIRPRGVDPKSALDELCACSTRNPRVIRRISSPPRILLSSVSIDHASSRSTLRSTGDSMTENYTGSHRVSSRRANSRTDALARDPRTPLNIFNTTLPSSLRASS